MCDSDPHERETMTPVPVHHSHIYIAHISSIHHHHGLLTVSYLCKNLVGKQWWLFVGFCGYFAPIYGWMATAYVTDMETAFRDSFSFHSIFRSIEEARPSAVWKWGIPNWRDPRCVSVVPALHYSRSMKWNMVDSDSDGFVIRKRKVNHYNKFIIHILMLF